MNTKDLTLMITRYSFYLKLTINNYEYNRIWKVSDLAAEQLYTKKYIKKFDDNAYIIHKFIQVAGKI